MRKVETCRACSGGTLELVFSLGEQSLSSFLLPGEEPKSGPLDLILCRSCGLFQLGHSYPGDLFFDWYGYRSGTNPMMSKALGEIAEAVKPYLQVGDSILDIGSNDGTFLRNVSAPGIRKVGVDPVKNLGPAAGQGLHLFVNDYFSKAAVAEHVRQYGRFKVVTMLAMFYHLENPLAFLREVREVLDDDGVIVIQMNYLRAMLTQNGYDNIVHEHQTYYSLTTLFPLLQEAGFGIWDVEENTVNGGSFRVWASPAPKDGYGAENPHRMTDASSARIFAMLEREEEDGLRRRDAEPYQAFWRRISGERAELRNLILRASDQGSVYVYGASTRGLAIMEFSKIDDSLVDGAAERNPEKIGRLYGGTGIPCVSEEEARAKADYFLVLPHHFLDEFIEREADWLVDGGLFIVPLPYARLVGPKGIEVSSDDAFRSTIRGRIS